MFVALTKKKKPAEYRGQETFGWEWWLWGCEDEWRTTTRVFSCAAFSSDPLCYFSISYVLVRWTQLFHFPSFPRILRRQRPAQEISSPTHSASKIELSWHESFLLHPIPERRTTSSNKGKRRKVFAPRRGDFLRVLFLHPCVRWAKESLWRWH